MKYGETHQQRFERKDREFAQERAKRETWRRKFAWFPVKMSSGIKVWLEDYAFREKYYDYSLGPIYRKSFWTTERMPIQ